MRIAIDANVIGSGRGGDESYLRGLLSGLALAADPTRDRFGLFVRPDARVQDDIAAHPAFVVHPLSARRVVRYTLALPMALARARRPFDLLVSINHAPPLSPVPRVLIIHDLSFVHHPEFYPRSTRLRLRLLVPFHVRQSRLIITGSDFSRRDLIDAFGVAPERVVVVPPVIASAPGRADEMPRTSARYFLYVGNLHPRKNLAGLLRAFQRALASGLTDHQLVIAGASWWGDASIGSLVAALPAGSVRVLGRVSDSERERLMRGAVALVYPSLFEGIGLPPLEAMAAGTPVIASNTAALPETCGDAALLIDPLDDAAIAAALLTIATDAGARARLRTRGLERASHFTAREAGERALLAFERALRTKVNERIAIGAAEEMKGG